MPRPAGRVAFGVALAALLGEGAVTSAERQPLTLEAIFSPDDNQRVDFDGDPIRILGWLEDGTHFLRSVDREAEFQPPLKVEALSGQSVPLFDAEDLRAALAEQPGFDTAKAAALPSAAIRLSPAHDSLLVRQDHHLYHYRPGSGQAVRLTTGDSPVEVEAFSPDRRFVSFVRDHDLHVVAIDTRREVSLTRGGTPQLISGRLDWVYQEELYGRGNYQGYWWSPDSTRLAFLRFDQSSVDLYTLVDHLSTPATTESVHYPKAGRPNPRVTLGVAGTSGGEPVWMDTSSYEADEHLFVRVGWLPDASQVIFLVQDREQTWIDINLGDPQTGATSRLLRESSPAFLDVDLSGEPHWLSDGSFLWRSARSGFHHLYRFASDGSLRRQLTAGDWEVRELYGVDEAGGWVYFSASELDPRETHIYRVRLDGSSFERLSERPGTHRASFDPSYSLFLDTWSDVETPPKVFLHRNDGTELRLVDANRVSALAAYQTSPVEFVQVPADDGFLLEAALVKPPDFDADRRYPVLQYAYGGPHAPVVRNAWGGTRQMWFQLLAQRGFVIWMCDNRSASAKGIQPTWEAHGRLGATELRDIETCLSWLRQRPWIDDSRIGIYGGSYGGYLAAFALTHSQSFKAGIAVAPVTDWRLYDTIYTERYLRTPDNNPQGYDNASVVRAASDLHGRLLLVHGTMDDNVHLQHTLRLAHALQLAGKDFEMMLYPGERHRFDGLAARYHLYRLMTRFLHENL